MGTFYEGSWKHGFEHGAGFSYSFKSQCFVDGVRTSNFLSNHDGYTFSVYKGSKGRGATRRMKHEFTGFSIETDKCWQFNRFGELSFRYEGIYKDDEPSLSIEFPP